MMPISRAARSRPWLAPRTTLYVLLVLGHATSYLVEGQGPQNPPRPPGAFPGAGQIQYLPQGIVAINNVSPSRVGGTPSSPSSPAPGSPSQTSATSQTTPTSPGDPNTPGSPGNAAGTNGAAESPALTTPPASPGAAPAPSAVSTPASPADAAATPSTSPAETPSSTSPALADSSSSVPPSPAVPSRPAQLPQQPGGPPRLGQPGPQRGVSPDAQAGVNAASSPAAVPAANPGPLVAPAHAPLAAAQAPAPLQRSAVDRRATVVDGVLQLQGPRLWPFDAAQRIALKSALIAAMPGVVADSIRIMDTEQASGLAERRLLQEALPVNAHFQAEAATAGEAATARDQITAAAAAGNLAAAMRSQGMTVESVRLLSVDLTTPAARVQLPSGAVNAAAIAGGVTAAALVIAAAIGLGVWWSRKRRGTPAPAEVPQEPEYRAEPFYCGSKKALSPESAIKSQEGTRPQPDRVIAMTDASHAAVMGLSSATGEVNQPMPKMSQTSTPSFESHSSRVSVSSAQVQATIDQLRSHADELSRATTPVVANASSTAKPLVLTPNANMDMLGRIAAANAQLSAFTASLSAETAAPTVSALLASRAADQRRLSVAGATGSKVMKLNTAMQYLTESSRFADKYEVESARIAGDSCIMANGKQLSSGCMVVLKFFVDEDAFSHLKRFHHQARDTQFIPGVLDMFEAGEVALGSGASPACIVSEAGQYSLAHYMARMERNPSAARQKSTLTQLLEAVAYLHGRSMVHREVQPGSCVWCDSVSRWRLAGSGAWARKGTDVALSYNLRYAAPEVVMADALGMATRLKMSGRAAEEAAHDKEAQSAEPGALSSTLAAVPQGPVLHVTQTASDMWAVGALAWELLTGRPLFGDAFSDEDVVMALLGFKPLPFEADPSLWVLFTESQAAVLLQGLLTRRAEQRLTVSKALHIMATLGDSN
ncbi:hypothetical protein CVIRNUC_002875 [Coccomyxa viridis]|uniref:Protein kinase domain-containing protein n=1 Tax=Coccomyxa viridis TaxID=1274662 RepID=A0AAV1HX17_9CHLO|nr:hypothetical protein CVIRNUC_002875 [Coccomyxa viridis]